jgi:Skp family chaperone for outer membrane proteins
MAKTMCAMMFGFLVCFCVVETTRSPDHLHASTLQKDEFPATRVAIVDMARIFKTSKAFEGARDKLKEKISESEEVAKKMLQEITDLAQKLKTPGLDPDTKKDLTTEVTAKSKEFEEFKKVKQKEFLTAESKIYLTIYNMVIKEIGDYADAHKIDLVMRYSSEALDDSDAQLLLQGMNRQVVFQNKLDITDDIIDLLRDQ